MVRQPPVIIQSTEVRAAHVADLQLLVSRRTGRVRQRFQLALEDFLLVLRLADFVEFVDGGGDGAEFA